MKNHERKLWSVLEAHNWRCFSSGVIRPENQPARDVYKVEHAGRGDGDWEALKAAIVKACGDGASFGVSRPEYAPELVTKVVMFERAMKSGKK